MYSNDLYLIITNFQDDTSLVATDLVAQYRLSLDS